MPETTTPRLTESEARLKQIRERRAQGDESAYGYEDIDLLLSLLDSQVSDDSVKWDATHWMLNVFTSDEFTFAQKVESLVKYHNDTATAMRTACVEKVKAMGQAWADRVDNSNDPTFKHHYQTRADAALEIMMTLQSLQVEQEKQ